MIFAGSVVVHAMGGWIALPAVLLLGTRRGRYTRDGLISEHPASNFTVLALGAWILTVSWLGFNFISTHLIESISGLVAANSLMAMVGGVGLAAQILGTLGGVAVGLIGSLMVYGMLKMAWGLRLDPEAEFVGADLSIHKLSATAERETGW
jgi:ammonia channel protein AmtB